MCIGKRGSFTKMKFRERKAFVIKWTIFRFLAGNNMRQKRKKKGKNEKKDIFQIEMKHKKGCTVLMLRFSKAPSRRHSINYTFFPLTMEISFESVFLLSFIHWLYCFFVVLINKETNEQKMELRKNHNWNYLNELSYVFRGWVMKVEYSETNEYG